MSYFEFTRATGQPIPGEFFQTPDGQAGLQVEYFNNPNLSGKPAATNIVPNLDFAWDGAPAEGVASARGTASAGHSVHLTRSRANVVR